MLNFNIDAKNQNSAYEPYSHKKYTYEVNKEYNIHMQMESANYDGNQIHKFWISIDDVIVGVGYNHNAQVLDDVRVFCAGPWHDVLDTTIRDLDYGALSSTNVTQGKFILLSEFALNRKHDRENLNLVTFHPSKVLS